MAWHNSQRVRLASGRLRVRFSQPTVRSAVFTRVQTARLPDTLYYMFRDTIALALQQTLGRGLNVYIFYNPLALILMRFGD